MRELVSANPVCPFGRAGCTSAASTSPTKEVIDKLSPDARGPEGEHPAHREPSWRRRSPIADRRQAIGFQIANTSEEGRLTGGAGSERWPRTKLSAAEAPAASRSAALSGSGQGRQVAPRDSGLDSLSNRAAHARPPQGRPRERGDLYGHFSVLTYRDDEQLLAGLRMACQGPVSKAASRCLLDSIDHAAGDRETKGADAESQQHVISRGYLGCANRY